MHQITLRAQFLKKGSGPILFKDRLMFIVPKTTSNGIIRSPTLISRCSMCCQVKCDVTVVAGLYSQSESCFAYLLGSYWLGSTSCLYTRSFAVFLLKQTVGERGPKQLIQRNVRYTVHCTVQYVAHISLANWPHFLLKCWICYALSES